MGKLTSRKFCKNQGVDIDFNLLLRNLGIDDYYFALESVETIANHIMALYGAKILAFTRNENVLDINLEKESDDSSVYIYSSEPGVSQLIGPQCERK